LGAVTASKEEEKVCLHICGHRTLSGCPHTYHRRMMYILFTNKGHFREFRTKNTNYGHSYANQDHNKISKTKDTQKETSPSEREA